MRPAPAWLTRLADLLLFALTLAAVGISLLQHMPDWAQLSVLLAFVTLFVVRWYLDSDRMAYIRANWLDLVLVVLLASPLLRLIMALKMVGLVPIMRVTALTRAHRDTLLRLLVLSSESFPAQMSLVFGMAFLFGVSAYLFEHAHNAAFASIADSLWWAIVTITTVGYGDIVPQSSGGRLVAVLAMVFGIAVYSLVIANVTRLIEKVGKD
ncbi:MAG: two pore domain potassium channel family protein [Zetaproteobacteria bacterium]|nr:MAG: two pore domain potassium channel family protein [Zetaproteobacteria bacterium]